MYKYEFVGERPIKTKSGVVVASDFTRIVHGGRGAYVEFSFEQMEHISMHRVHTYHYYYNEFATIDDIKVYFQLHRVKYADYIPTMFYISPVYLKGFVRAGKYIIGLSVSKTVLRKDI